MPFLSVIILTHEEELNLPHCLASLSNLDCEIVVVDSGSSDRTVEIAREFGAAVYEHPFENQARQINWALDHIPLSANWVLRLDADERLTPELADELRAMLPSVSASVSGLLVKRRVYFWGKWIRHGGYYPIWLLRVWRNGLGRSEDAWMDEHIVVRDGAIERLKGDIIDENRKGLSFWVDKHNKFSDREIKNVLSRNEAITTDQAGGQAARKRYLKHNFYDRCPLFLRAFLYWMYRYFLRLGFLDGLAGLVFHFLQGFWYRVLIDAKLYERSIRSNVTRTPG